MTSFQIGNSLFDEPGSTKVAGLVEKAKKNNVKIVFPVDYITADKFDKNAKASCILVMIFLFCICLSSPQTGIATDQEGIPDGWLGLDVGPKSRELFRATVLEARTILWNG
jgi:3-phosphoglycerate kinase